MDFTANCAILQNDNKDSTITYYQKSDKVFSEQQKISDNVWKLQMNTVALMQQESPAIADKPVRRLRKVCTVYVRAVGL